MLKGIDISHHNKYQIFPTNGRKPTLDISKQDFVIMKATEGKSFVDPMLDDYIKLLGQDQLYGFYHFARPERNRAYDEAKHFCDTIGKYGEEALLVLDWEAQAVAQPIEWALDWMKIVERKYGKKPLIYCSSWYTKKCQPLLENNNGLWVAHYTNKKAPTVYTYSTYALWQYSSEPYDKDVFNGNRKQWQKYTERH